MISKVDLSIFSDKMHLLQKNLIYVLTLLICVGVSKQSVDLQQSVRPQEDVTSTVDNSVQVNDTKSHRKGRCEYKAID